MRAIFRTIPIYGQHFIADCMPPDDKFFFKHDKNNIHDAYAVLAINKKGEPIGWVPKEISPALVYLLRKKINVYGIRVKSACRMWPNANTNSRNFVCDVVVP